MSEIRLMARHRAAVAGLLWGLMGLLVLIHIGLQLVKLGTGHDDLFGLVRLFNVDDEANVPTLFSTLLLVFAAVLLLFIGWHEKRRNARDARRWVVLAAGFAFMAVDESAQIHDILDGPVREVMQGRATGIFHYGWVVPYAVVVVALGLYFVGFFLRLPARPKSWFGTAAAVFVGGALGFEFLEGLHAEVHGEHTPLYMLLTTTQEIMEMSGVIVFTQGLLDYIATFHPDGSPAGIAQPSPGW